MRLRKNLKGILRLRLRLGSSTGEQEAQGIYRGWGYDLAVEQSINSQSCDRTGI